MIVMEAITNKKAYFDYEILETLEAGIVLTGPEVKSVKRGQIDLSASYVNIDQAGIPWLINANVSPYPPAWQVQQNYQPDRSRKLLLKKEEIIKLATKIKTKGLTIIPLKVYNIGGLIKIQIGLARGKKKYDKREAIKRREVERKIRESLKR